MRTSTVSRTNRPAKNSKFWSHHLVSEAIEALYKANRALNHNSIRRDNSHETKAILLRVTGRATNGLGVCQAGTKLWGSWDRALRNSGVDPKAVRLDRFVQNHSHILNGIRTLHRAGIALHTHSIQKNRSLESQEILRKVLGFESNAARIYQAAHRHYGSWNIALKKAGIDPESVSGSLYFWTKSNLSASISALSQAGVSLHTRAIGQDSSEKTREIIRENCGSNTSGSALLTAARKHFGSWDRALESAGIPPTSVRRTRIWTKESTIKAIRCIADAGLPLNFSSITESSCSSTLEIIENVTGRKLTGVSLCLAGIRFFGTWTKALDGAGLSSLAIRRDRVWTKSTILVAIGRLYVCGVSLNTYNVFRDRSDRTSRLLSAIVGRATNASGLYQAARLNFGSWDRALLAAGIQPASVRRGPRHWTKALIISALKELNRHGVALNCARIAKDESVITKTVLESITGRKTTGRGLYYVAIREFGSWTKAVDIAGIAPTYIRFKGGKKIECSPEQVAAVIRLIHSTGIALNWRSMTSNTAAIRKITREKLGRPIGTYSVLKAARAKFGRWDEALRAAGYNPDEIRLKWATRKSNLPILPHQVERMVMPDGQVRLVALLGAPARAPEDAIQEAALAKCLGQAVRGLPKEDQELAASIFEIILDADAGNEQGNLMSLLAERLGGKISREKVTKIFEALRSDASLRAFRDDYKEN